MFSFYQQELREKIEKNCSKAKSIGIRPTEPLAVSWIKRSQNRSGFIHSPMTAGIIGMSGKNRFETFTLIKQALDPEDEDQALIANWEEDITKVAPTAISAEEITGNILGIVSLAKAKQLELIFDPRYARRQFGTSTNKIWHAPNIPQEFTEIDRDEEYVAPTKEKDIPVFAVIPKTMVIEFGSEIIAGKTKFEDAIAILQTSHENASIVGQAWFFLQEKYSSKLFIRSLNLTGP